MENLAYVTVNKKEFWETETLKLNTDSIKPEQSEIKEVIQAKVANLNQKLDLGYDMWAFERKGAKISDADKGKLIAELQTVIAELNETIGTLCKDYEMTTGQEKWKIQSTIDGVFSGKSLFIEESKTASLGDVVEQNGAGIQIERRAVLSLQ